MTNNLFFCHIKECQICGRRQFEKWDSTSYKHYLGIRPDLDTDNDPIKKYSQVYLKPITLKRCQNCNFVFATPQLTSNSLSYIYQKNGSYFSHYRDDNSPAIKALRKSHQIEITQLEKFKSRGKIIDIGCSGGLYLSLLGAQWKLTGLEIDQKALASARKRLRKNTSLINSQLEEAKLPLNHFDVVVMRGVIEHVPNPRYFLKKAQQILKQGGVLYINTPNVESICAHLYKKSFRLIDPIHHIWYFSPNTINKLLEDYGFQIAAIYYNYFNTPYFHAKDLFTIFKDIFLYKITGKRAKHASPPFYGNFMDIYAYKVNA